VTVFVYEEEPFRSRQGLDWVLLLKFRYSAALVGTLKRALCDARPQAAPWPSCGGWLTDRGVWFCHRLYWSRVRRALERAGHEVVRHPGRRQPLGAPRRWSRAGKRPAGPRPPPVHDLASRAPGSPAAPAKTVEHPPGSAAARMAQVGRVAGIRRRPPPRPVPAARASPAGMSAPTAGSCR
jgi:hypothetical protein